MTYETAVKLTDISSKKANGEVEQLVTEKEPAEAQRQAQAKEEAARA